MEAKQNDHSTEDLENAREAQISPEAARVERRKSKLCVQIEETEQEIADTQKRLDEVNAELGSVDAQEIVQRHIKLLHQYNEIKDVATGLFGLIAERRGVRIKDIYEDFGVEQGD